MQPTVEYFRQSRKRHIVAQLSVCSVRCTEIPARLPFPLGSSSISIPRGSGFTVLSPRLSAVPIPVSIAYHPTGAGSFLSHDLQTSIFLQCPPRTATDSPNVPCREPFTRLTIIGQFQSRSRFIRSSVHFANITYRVLINHPPIKGEYLRFQKKRKKTVMNFSHPIISDALKLNTVHESWRYFSVGFSSYGGNRIDFDIVRVRIKNARFPSVRSRIEFDGRSE